MLCKRLTDGSAPAARKGRGMAKSTGVARLERIALLGNYLPRKCGLATFTTDVHDALERLCALVERGEHRLVQSSRLRVT